MAMFQKRSPENPLANLGPQPSARELQPVVPPQPPPFLRDTEVRTSIAADAVINGKLSFTTPTRVEGKLKGELRCTQRLIIGATATIEGWVKADELRIEGEVRGEIAQTRRVEIAPGGRFTGKLESAVLVIRDRGVLNGECRPLRDPPAVADDGRELFETAVP